ncbi:MAG TPA: hypothetical protein VH165_01925 [Kofleriaceae bacterium]|jgi:hypothetical protein|nr:hypothetical protein [Kofleriaceae bacterium]
MRGLAVVMLLAACGAASAAPATSGTPGAGPADKVTPAKLLTVADLAAAGAKITKISDTESLVCGTSGCICMKDLACGTKGCVTLADNLAAFRKALARDTQPVYCEIADTGQFCDLSYFRFEGDIDRWETRFFDASGQLVAQRNGTDYPAYCGGKAHLQVAGRIPDCAMKPRHVELICAQRNFKSKAGVLPNPRELVLP